MKCEDAENIISVIRSNKILDKSIPIYIKPSDPHNTNNVYLEIPLPLEASTKAQFLKQAVSRAATLYGPHPTPLQVKRSFPFYIICEETFFPKVYAV